jgi:hypothetical protein
METARSYERKKPEPSKVSERHNKRIPGFFIRFGLHITTKTPNGNLGRHSIHTAMDL